MAKAKRTKIEDLPVPEKELTEEEAEKVEGGLVNLGTKAGTSTSYTATGSTEFTFGPFDTKPDVDS